MICALASSLFDPHPRCASQRMRSEQHRGEGCTPLYLAAAARGWRRGARMLGGLVHGVPIAARVEASLGFVGAAPLCFD